MGRATGTEPASRATKRKWERKFNANREAAATLERELRTMVVDAYAENLTFADIAYMIGNTSPSTARKYKDEGDKIRSEGSTADTE